MPFTRPTLSELRNQVEQDIITSTPVGGSLLRNSVLRVLGWVQAGLAHLHYGYLDWIALQAIPYTCSGEYLEGWAGLVGITRKPSVAATGVVTFTGTVGETVLAGAQLTRSDGAVFTLDADATIGGGGTVTAAITAAVGGSAGNTDTSTALTLVSPVSGVSSSATVSTAVAGGVDVETDDSLRERMLLRYQQPPQGGDLEDYVEWALAVPGVTRAWCAPLAMGAGTVTVYFMMDTVEAAFDGFPQGTNGVAGSETRDTPATGDQLIVADAIYPLRPVTALVYCVAPSANPIAFTISGLSLVSVAVQNAVKAAIGDVFKRLGSPIAGTAVNLDQIEQAISAVVGSSGFVITSPAANIANVSGQLPTVGVVTWT